MEVKFQLKFVFKSWLVWQYIDDKDIVLDVGGKCTDVHINLRRVSMETARIIAVSLNLLNIGHSDIEFWGTCTYTDTYKILTAIAHATDINN